VNFDKRGRKIVKTAIAARIILHAGLIIARTLNVQLSFIFPQPTKLMNKPPHLQCIYVLAFSLSLNTKHIFISKIWTQECPFVKKAGGHTLSHRQKHWQQEMGHYRHIGVSLVSAELRTPPLPCDIGDTSGVMIPVQSNCTEVCRQTVCIYSVHYFEHGVRYGSTAPFYNM